MARKFTFEDSETGLPPMANAIVKSATAQLRERMVILWPRIQAAIDAAENSTVSVPLKVRISQKANRPALLVKGKVLQSWEDEAEVIVDDPSQTTLPLDGGAA